MFTAAIPVYQVASLGRARRFYEEVLGFQVAGEVVSRGSDQARMIRDQVEIVLRQGNGTAGKRTTNPWDAYVRLTGIDRFFAEVGGKADVLRGPEDTADHERELELRDCDGYILAFAEWEHERDDDVCLFEIDPVLAVRDVATAARWYVDKLEFRRVAEEGVAGEEAAGRDTAALWQDGIQIFLQQVSDPVGSAPEPFRPDVYLQARKRYVQKLFDRIAGEPCVIRPLEMSQDGRPEFEIADSDGHILCVREAW